MNNLFLFLIRHHKRQPFPPPYKQPKAHGSKKNINHPIDPSLRTHKPLWLVTPMTRLMVQAQPHFLLVTFPAQGHLNPSLQFAKRLLRLGVKVTLATSVSAHRRMTKAGQIPADLDFSVFSDGFDDGYKPCADDTTVFLNQLRIRGTQSLKETISSCAKDGTPITCLVYTLLLPWAAEVARTLNVPSALLWIQPASVFRIYYYCFNGYDKLIGHDCNSESWSISLPGLPTLKIRDLPSFFNPSNTYNFALPLFKEQLDALDLEEWPRLLVNSFEELEHKALEAINEKIKMVAVGPLIPSAYLDENDPSDRSFGGDLFEMGKDCNVVEWMNTKDKGSIVYISFGSIIMLSKKQKEAMARALLEIRMPFLWVIRDKENDTKEGEKEEEISFMEELKEMGKVVSWCSQLEVLSHTCLGCFVTHCGWNSTLESVVCGVPVVAFPHWTDQSTNAKLLEDVWGTGVRVAADEEGFVESGEIRRCVEMVMGGGERGMELRKNAKKWKESAREAMKEGGSSDVNLKDFVEEVQGIAARKAVDDSSRDLEKWES